MDTRQAIFESETLTHLYHVGGADPSSLSEEELVRYRLLIHNAIWPLWHFFSQSRNAELPAETWDAQIPMLRRIFFHETCPSIQRNVEAQ